MSNQKKLKVLLISKSFKIGGSAVGSKNLSIALKNCGINIIEIDGFEYLKKNFFLYCIRYLERILDTLVCGKECHFLRLAPYTINLKNLVTLHKPDVIQLCDISHNTINPIIPKNLNIPVFHRLSDFWPYEGIFHYPTKKNFIYKYIDNLFKSNIISKSNKLPVLICTSYWTLENLNLNVEKYFIKNAVKTYSFKEKKLSNKRMIKLGFISNNLNLKRKGLNEIIDILKIIRNFKIELLLYGNNSKKILMNNKNVNIVEKGPFNKNKKKLVYNSFDILLCPSKFDNSPNVVTESISSGTPVIGQMNSGMNSYINNNIGRLINYHLKNKEQAKDFFEQALKEIIKDYSLFSKNCVMYANSELSYSEIGSKYKKLYRQKLTS